MGDDVLKTNRISADRRIGDFVSESIKANETETVIS